MSPAATDDDATYEFYAPFAHVPGRYEWCRIRSPSHGVFDTFILLGVSTEAPATVYVNSVLGEDYMRDRYPECTTVRVPPGGLRITESPDGRTVSGHLESESGPVTRAAMTLAASPHALPSAVPYGGTGAPVWGSRFTCWGVDLVLEAIVDGVVEGAAGRHDLRAEPGIVTVGSFGCITPLP